MARGLDDETEEAAAVERQRRQCVAEAPAENTAAGVVV